jgi:hypothetical protein
MSWETGSARIQELIDSGNWARSHRTKILRGK